MSTNTSDTENRVPFNMRIRPSTSEAIDRIVADFNSRLPAGHRKSEEWTRSSIGRRALGEFIIEHDPERQRAKKAPR